MTDMSCKTFKYHGTEVVEWLVACVTINVETKNNGCNRKPRVHFFQGVVGYKVEL